MLPPQLQTLIDQIDACEREAETVVAGLDDDAVNAVRPEAGAWSIAQCLDHLVKTNEFYLRGMIEAVEAVGATGKTSFNGLNPTFVGRWFARQMEPPPPFKVKTPVQDIVPGPRLRAVELVPAFRNSHRSYRALVAAAAEVDVNKVVVPNPFQRRLRMRLSTVLMIIPGHDRRHLWQAGNVRRALGR